jgi:hypothetical protein
METLLSLENRMRTWIPRPHSAKLKSRVFPRRQSAPSGLSWLQLPRVATISAWLAVVMLSGYAVLRDSALNGTTYPPVMAVTLSNQTRGAYLGVDYLQPHTVQNAPPAQRFQSTGSPASTSSMFSLSLLRTNDAR